MLIVPDWPHSIYRQRILNPAKSSLGAARDQPQGGRRAGGKHCRAKLANHLAAVHNWNMYVNRLGAARIVAAEGPLVGPLLNPDWNAIEHTIREMDGVRCFCVELHHVTAEWEGREFTDEAEFEVLPYMAIIGSHDHFRVFVSLPDKSHVHLLRTNYSEEDDDWYADLAATLQAAKVFSTSGQLDPSLKWEVRPSS